MSVLFKIVLGLVVFWWWFFVGSTDHCPRCGTSLRSYTEYGGPWPHSTLRRSCACGWHE
jgi:hypothetical protein